MNYNIQKKKPFPKAFFTFEKSTLNVPGCCVSAWNSQRPATRAKDPTAASLKIAAFMRSATRDMATGADRSGGEGLVKLQLAEADGGGVYISFFLKALFFSKVSMRSSK